MMNEALSFKITEILSFENLQNPPFLVKYQPNEIFFKYSYSMYWSRVESMLFDNFMLQYAIVTTCKWLILENLFPHPFNTIKNVKKLDI